MATDIDPEGVELRELHGCVRFEGARVLEVGAGSGRLARRYTPASRSVVGIDPDARELMAGTEAGEVDHLRFVRAGALQLPFKADTFDIVLFGWSL